MGMREKINDLEARRAQVRLGGGEKKIAKQHASGKLTARERLSILFDPGTFQEIDEFVKHHCTNFGMDKVEIPGEGVVTGYGKIGGRGVFAFSQDFTAQGGTLGEMHAKKICKVMDMALEMKVPLIGIKDSGGARIQEGVFALSGYGQIFYRNTMASGVIPQISVIMGPCAGGAVYSPALTDFIFMTKKANMFITGPQVIKATTGEDIDPDKLGGPMTHNQTSGVAHFMADDDESCLQLVRKLLEFLPANNTEAPPRVMCTDDPDRIDETLTDILPESPTRAYNMLNIITRVVDNGEFFQVQQYYAQNILIGFARLNGHTVGIVANQPRVLAGCLDIDASDKASRFIRFCDAFNIPLITFVDVPGFLPGISQEFGGIIRHGAKMLYAYSEAVVPKITLVIRKAYGGAYQAMCSRDLGADQVIAWPTAEIAVMGAEGAANIIFRDVIEKAENPQEMRQQKIEEYRDKFSNPYIAAAEGFVDRVIDPRLTRPQLIQALEMCLTKQRTRPPRKHGNFPV
ncbi:MAG: methylmalonyl-CoA carboxyltransferase [Firmicutes bacterium]|nr:methylmalonyl-CoA carboxyltransferase [Bacillota bacterium]